MAQAIRVFIGVGSNLGDRKRMIEQAKSAVSSHSRIQFLRGAPIYETEPVGGTPQGLYLNTVWEIETDLSAEELLDFLLRIESQMGRKRLQKAGPRTIDLDLLLYGDEVVEKPGLSVPHPRMHERWFVLKPLWDLASDAIHPVLKKSIFELLDQIHENHQKSSPPR